MEGGWKGGNECLLAACLLLCTLYDQFQCCMYVFKYIISFSREAFPCDWVNDPKQNILNRINILHYPVKCIANCFGVYDVLPLSLPLLWMAGALKWNKSISTLPSAEREFLLYRCTQRAKSFNVFNSSSIVMPSESKLNVERFLWRLHNEQHRSKIIFVYIPEIHHKSMIQISFRTVDHRKETMLCRFYM